MNITKEMTDWFYKRTYHHVDLVEKYINIYYDGKVPYNLLDNGHDESKFEEPEFTPYVIITWDYRCKEHGIPFIVPNNIKEDLNKATLHHIKSNRHHPEYWVERETELLSRDNRDSADIPTIHIEDMPIDALVEMCADWCAMSEEKGNTPFDWYNKVIGVRWDFGPTDNKTIIKILMNMWVD